MNKPVDCVLLGVSGAKIHEAQVSLLPVALKRLCGGHARGARGSYGYGSRRRAVVSLNLFARNSTRTRDKRRGELSERTPSFFVDGGSAN